MSLFSYILISVYQQFTTKAQYLIPIYTDTNKCWIICLNSHNYIFIGKFTRFYIKTEEEVLMPVATTTAVFFSFKFYINVSTMVKYAFEQCEKGAQFLCQCLPERVVHTYNFVGIEINNHYSHLICFHMGNEMNINRLVYFILIS